MNPVLVTYLAYALASIGLTAWVARTLFRNGALFLVDVFEGDERMARAVNQLPSRTRARPPRRSRATSARPRHASASVARPRPQP